MALDLEAPVPAGSYAWCSDCTWRDDSEWCHKNGQHHTGLMAHIVHVHTPDLCDDPHVTALGMVTSCIRLPNHSGGHADSKGLRWADRPVHNPVENS